MKKLLLLISSILLPLILFELVLRIWFPEAHYIFPVAVSEESLNRGNLWGEDQRWPLMGVYVSDKRLGRKLKPNYRGRIKNSEYDTEFIVNSEGYRDQLHGPKKEGTFRVLFCGDSFTMGFGVEQDETFVSQLKRLLNSHDGHYEFINTGIMGYDTNEYLLSYQFGSRRFEPDLVVLEFWVGDDLISTTKLNVVPDQLTLEKSFLNFRIILRRELYSYSLLADSVRGNPFLHRFFRSMGITLSLPGIDQVISTFSQNYTAKTSEGWGVTQSLLQKMGNLVKEDGAKFIILIVPLAQQVYDDQWEGLKRIYALDEENYSRTKPNDIMAEFCKDNGIPFLDLLPIFRTKQDASLYYKRDGHFTTQGHKLVTKILYERFMTDNLLVKGGQE